MDLANESGAASPSRDHPPRALPHTRGVRLSGWVPPVFESDRSLDAISGGHQMLGTQGYPTTTSSNRESISGSLTNLIGHFRAKRPC
jgi:hypothetical protein